MLAVTWNYRHLSQPWDWNMCREVVYTSQDSLDEYGEYGYLVFGLSKAFESAQHRLYSEELILPSEILWIKPKGVKTINLNPLYTGDLNLRSLAEEYCLKNIRGEVEIT
jgi:hypothetical protein